MPENNVYKGVRKGSSVWVTKNGKPLPLHLEIYNHSPTGFNFGYAGSGPAQLALAIMVEEYGPDLDAHPISYMDLKNQVIAGISGSSFEIDSTAIQGCIKQIATSQRLISK